MKQTWQRLKIAGTTVFVLLVMNGASQARDLTITAWGGASQAAQRDVFYKPFTQKSGIKLVEDSWRGGVGVLRTKVLGGNASWDVVQVEVEDLLIGCGEGLFEKIDWSALGGKDSFIPSAVHECGVGAISWAMAFGYDGDRLKEGPKSWADFWDVRRFPGKRGMRQGAKFTLEAALMADGVEPSKVYELLRSPGGVDRAFRKLGELKPHIIWWSSVSQVPDMLASGEVIMSVITPGRLLAANEKDRKNFKLVWNGSMASLDYWVILKGSPNIDPATKLISFMTLPENQAKYSSAIALGVTRKAALGMVDPKVAPNLPTFAENAKNAVTVDAQFWMDNTDQLNQRFTAWAAK